MEIKFFVSDQNSMCKSSHSYEYVIPKVFKCREGKETMSKLNFVNWSTCFTWIEKIILFFLFLPIPTSNEKIIHFCPLFSWIYINFYVQWWWWLQQKEREVVGFKMKSGLRNLIREIRENVIESILHLKL